MNKKEKDELNWMYLHDMPYIVEFEDGTLDYCLGKSFDDAAKVIRLLLKIKKGKQRRKNDSTD